MSIVVEDGTGSNPAANSYISVVDAQAYLDARGRTVTITDALLLQAMGILNGLKWRGLIVSDTQALQWARVGVVDCENRTILSTVVPPDIGSAQAYLAYHISVGIDPSAVGTKKVIQETVDVISITYSDKGGDKTSYSIYSIPDVKNLLKCYLTDGGYLGRA